MKLQLETKVDCLKKWYNYTVTKVGHGKNKKATEC